ncbi:16S rRNA (guanine(966)-N(2))-methyltransferase RsmD [Herbivorax sp. ANBcel31]|uniref:16S rRNA (guanine(966)-N(2))-methyltransferase RsmD n=1 Tax=Herbivorax sp. ANBcel31 TaxID=3069754 RepID=UPI0027B27D2C|nr:16S rRNA (guanine(966)-N(2))-methyltransferase RsmD [Herbivorax sp. ANBcel31]MDQ2085030.1 16S rRNA (guanine(966)-N(2))-methyltransferase RsmD [Herbivorax sp. ANBcel31]
MEENVILRVISGSAKGHKLKTINGFSTRPTTDRVKESVFNILAGVIAKSRVLDLYSGTGSLGIESLSRGADFALFVDKSRECFMTIKQNLSHTKLSEKSSIMNMDVFVALDKLSKENRKFDIIFLDPPYNKNLVEETLKCLVENDIIEQDGIVIVEHDLKDEVPQEVEHFKKIRHQKYGDTIISFYEA